jgi:hypothetical protein
MNRRPHGRKPTIALWMLVALADLLILSAATGVLVPVMLAVAVVVVGGFAAVRMMTRRAETTNEAVVRRRA